MIIPTSTEILKDYLPPYSVNVDQVKLLKYIENALNNNIKFINQLRYLTYIKMNISTIKQIIITQLSELITPI